MKNIGRIAYPGMMETDKEILNIMIEVRNKLIIL